MRPHFALQFFVFVSLAAAAQAQTTWYVDAAAVPPGNGTPASPYASLQYAIAQPTTVGGDRIEVAAGTYAEPIDFLGKAIHVVGVSGAVNTIIDGEGIPGNRSAVVFQSGEGRDSVLEGFTVTNGIGTYDPIQNDVLGGGIRFEDSSPTIANCVVVQNEAGVGGGAYGLNSSPRFVDSTIADNDALATSKFWGGGVGFSGGVIELERVVIDGNHAFGFGAGVWLSDARATLRGCVISNNTSSYDDGGGLYAAHSVVVLQRCTLSDNLAFDGGQGGGLAVANGARVTAIETHLSGNVADIDHSGGGAFVDGGGRLIYLGGSITDNFASDGGGLYVNWAAGGTAFVAGCTFRGNVAQAFQAGSGSGGAVHGKARLFRCLIEGNEAVGGASFPSGEGGGTYLASLNHCSVVGNTALFHSGGAWGATKVVDSIFWGNVPPALGSAGSVTYSDVEGGHPGTGNIDADPLFTNPALGDYTLSPLSPCIDAGDPNGPLDPDGTRADMGAFPFDQSAPGTAGSTPTLRSAAGVAPIK